MATAFDAWIDVVLARSGDLRDKGVLSIGVDGCTATFAPAEAKPFADDAPDDEPAWTEPANVWEDPASYPSGFVPSMDIDDLRKERRR